MRQRWHPALPALGAALLFGLSTPLAKGLLGDLPPMLVAGLLYLGSGVGLGAWRLLTYDAATALPLQRQDRPWLLGAIVSGGILAPLLLMLGLQRLTAASASLLLNLEAVFTALIAWLIFKEHVQHHLVLGMGLIVAGGGLLAWQPGALTTVDPVGISYIAGACLGWAIDNNLTRRIAAHNAVFIAMLKGLCAGIVNTGLALLLGATLPGWHSSLLVMGIGLLGYGVSLIWFVLALRNLGTARTGAYFSLAPFIGAAAAILWLHEPASWPFWIAASLMGMGVWLHLREAHDHLHTHEPLVHNHRHVHDAHHQHGHDFAWDGREPHTHPHRHEPLTHSHPHYPDIHHRHSH